MLLIDKRMGSGEMAKFMALLKLPVEVCDLSFGDFAFLGNGEGGLPVSVGVERKALSDWISSFRTGRFSGHQLPGLLQCYQCLYVVIEGYWRIGHDAPHLIQVPKGKHWKDLEVGGKVVIYRELEAMLMTFELRGGVLFRFTKSKTETCKFISTLYHWWKDKEWEEHRSHLQFRTLQADKQLLMKPSLCREWAARLPGIGWERSKAVALHFKSARAMVQAPQKEWVQIEGIGEGIAKGVQKALDKGDKGDKEDKGMVVEVPAPEPE
jgi:ERCC4-type nuclease